MRTVAFREGVLKWSDIDTWICNVWGSCYRFLLMAHKKTGSPSIYDEYLNVFSLFGNHHAVSSSSAMQ